MNTAIKMSGPLDISRALAIDGWMTEPELLWLAEQAACHDFVVEIGSFLGRSTRALGDHARGKVLAVDDWVGPREIFIPGEVRAGLYDQFVDNVADLITAGKVLPAKIDHGDDAVLRIYTYREKPDMVFIDGDHGYEAAKRDILFWKDRIPSGGLLCGHDAQDAYVCAAVRELLENPGVVPDTEIWVQYV